MTTIIIIVVAILLVLIGIYISISNKLNRYQVKIDEANSGIDVALTKRYDVLTKMIEVVKGYAKHEKETLFEVINLRKGMSLEEKSKENAKMDRTMEKINVLAESYPELKSSENYNTYVAKYADLDLIENLLKRNGYLNRNSPSR